MKVSELKIIIDKTIEYSALAGDCDVVIPIQSSRHTVGAIPCVGVMNAFKGFDWENHLFILTPEVRVKKASE